MLFLQERGETWHHFVSQISDPHHGEHFLAALHSSEVAKTNPSRKRHTENEVFSLTAVNLVQGHGKRAQWRWPRFLFVCECGVKHYGRSLMQHGECISTAVSVTDRGLSLYLHTIDLRDGSVKWWERGRKEGVSVCVTVEEVGGGGFVEVCPNTGVIKFVSRTHLVSPGCSSLIHNRC